MSRRKSVQVVHLSYIESEYGADFSISATVKESDCSSVLLAECITVEPAVLDSLDVTYDNSYL